MFVYTRNPSPRSWTQEVILNYIASLILGYMKPCSEKQNKTGIVWGMRTKWACGEVQ